MFDTTCEKMFVRKCNRNPEYVDNCKRKFDASVKSRKL